MEALHALLLQFEALGDNCEFGLVQRQGGAEPLGLLRFAGFHIPIDRRLGRLIEALDRGFEGLGRPGTVRVEAQGEAGRREYMVCADSYDLVYHSFQREGEVDPLALRQQEERRLEFLRRKLIDDLADAEKLLVWKSNLPHDRADIARLLDRLRRFGPNALLWVETADEAHPPGSAEQLGEGFFKGYVDRFAPYGQATDISYPSWFAMCEAAHRLWRPAALERAEPAPESPAMNAEPAVEVLPEFQGESYLDLLRRFHAVLQPQSYLEIGSKSGQSLSLAECPSIAIDPAFELDPSFMGRKRICSLHQMTSDRFFEQFDPRALLGRSVDFAFLDGMHLAEYLLRDFANTERVCRRNSVIALHDCVPVEAAVARREPADLAAMNASAHPDWWAGDVWKTVVLLRRFRPDLRIYSFDAQPTGLVAVTNLDPASTVIADNYDVMLAAVREMDLGAFGVRNFVDSLGLMSTRVLRTHAEFSAYFWL
jgi:hypothetical protein